MLVIASYAVAASIAKASANNWLSWLNFVENIANIKLGISFGTFMFIIITLKDFECGLYFAQ